MRETTILVVDDRQTSRRLIGRRLNERGYRTIEAEDGNAGWAAFKENSPDAIVTDIYMPEADGLELLERVRAARKVPVFCITASPNLDTGLAAMKRGAEYYYRWPMDMDRLLADIDSVLGKGSHAGLPIGLPDRFQLDEIRETASELTATERRSAIEAALRETRGNIEQAARVLNISRRTLYHWLDRYGVERGTRR